MSHTIALPGVLTADTALRAKTALLGKLQALPTGASIALDAAGVQAFDSAGLALVLACRRAGQMRQQDVRVQGWTPSLQSLALVYGVLPLLDPESSLSAM